MSKREIINKILDKLEQEKFTGETRVYWKDGIPLVFQPLPGKFKITEATILKI